MRVYEVASLARLDDCGGSPVIFEESSHLPHVEVLVTVGAFLRTID